MEEEIIYAFALTLYKVLTLASGVFITYLGYKLFIAGIWGESGDLDAQFGNNRLVLKKAAPGTFFALFGAIIISITVYRGLGINTESSDSPVQQGSAKVELPAELPFNVND